MKKIVLLTLMALQVSAQNLSIEEMESCTNNSFEEDRTFLEGKGFVFLKDKRDMAQTLISYFQRTGKDTVVVGLVNDNVKVWGVELQFRSKATFLSYKKAVVAKGYILDKKTMNSDMGERYKKASARFILMNEPYGGILGPHYEVNYYNQNE